MKPGTRVVCIESVFKGVVRVVGRGMLVSETVPAHGRGRVLDALRDAGAEVAVIELDGGKTVFGCDVWYVREDLYEELEARAHAHEYRIVEAAA